MSTQVLECDVDTAPSQVSLRDDVTAVLLLIVRAGRPVKLVRMRRPSDGLLKLDAELRSTREADAARAPAVDTPDAGLARVSVVIPTHERPDDLQRCLTSLASVRAAGHEVIVVDNSPRTSRTKEVVERFGVRYVLEPVAGANRARNAGLAVASREIVAFVDDDVIVSRNWIACVGAAFANPAVACLTGLVLPFELETAAQEAFEVYCQHRRDLGAHLYTRDELPASAAGIVGMGANMAFRREVLLALGGFDARFGPGTRTRTGDETDMFARTLDAGWAIVYSPDAYAWHRHRRTWAELRSCVFGYGVGLYSMLTKRLVEQRDLGAIVTGGRWLVGPVVKAVRARLVRAASPPWSVVLAETAGSAFGPFCFGYEAWRARRADRAAAR